MQQVNLFFAIPQKPKQILPPKLMLSLAGGFFALLILLQVGVVAHYVWQHNHVKKLTTQKKTMFTTLKTAAEKYARLHSTDSLKEKILVLENETNIKASQINLLSNSEQIQGFSDAMRTLAIATPKGVWLTQIEINHASGEVAIRGNSLQKVLVPQLIQGLEKTKTFSGKNFKLVDLVKSEKNYFSFEIGNKLLSEDERKNQKTN